jgi:hypothetical protein
VNASLRWLLREELIERLCDCRRRGEIVGIVDADRRRALLGGVRRTGGFVIVAR